LASQLPRGDIDSLRTGCKGRCKPRLRARQRFQSYGPHRHHLRAFSGNAARRRSLTWIGIFLTRDGRMLHLHEGWKRWLALNCNNLAWIALVSGGILFTTLLMK